MKNLQLSLKTKWFNLTKEGIKKEDYRKVTAYWASRLCKIDGVKMSQKWWEANVFNGCLNEEGILDFIRWRGTLFEFKQNIMILGYPKSGDEERILVYENEGIELRWGNKEWGAELGEFYFVIKHGKRIN